MLCILGWCTGLIRPHRKHAVHRCGILLRMWLVTCSAWLNVSVYLCWPTIRLIFLYLWLRFRKDFCSISLINYDYCDGLFKACLYRLDINELKWNISGHVQHCELSARSVQLNQFTSTETMWMDLSVALRLMTQWCVRVLKKVVHSTESMIQPGA